MRSWPLAQNLTLFGEVGFSNLGRVGFSNLGRVLQIASWFSNLGYPTQLMAWPLAQNLPLGGPLYPWWTVGGPLVDPWWNLGERLVGIFSKEGFC